jgi:aldehyde dehydrogenase
METLEATKRIVCNGFPDFQNALRQLYRRQMGGPRHQGEYFDNISPIDGKVYSASVGAIHQRRHRPGARRRPYRFRYLVQNFRYYTRSNILLKIADIMEQNLDYLARVETVDNGKPVRETS